MYRMLPVCVLGFSEGKSEASKQATNFGLAETGVFYFVLTNIIVIYSFKNLIVLPSLNFKKYSPFVRFCI